MGEELETTTPGVEESTAGAAAEPTAEKPEGQKPVNLDDLPEFRAWKSATDRRIAEAQRAAAEATQAKAKLQEMEEKLAQAQLADADPEDQARYYQSELRRLKQEREQQERQQAAQRQLEQEAVSALAELGLDVNTEGLDWSGGATQEGYTKLLKSAARVVKKKAEEAAKQLKQQTAEAARTARQQTLEETGASRVSTAAGSPARSDLAAEYDKEAAEIGRRGGDRSWQMMQLRKKYRELGYEPLRPIRQ